MSRFSRHLTQYATSVSMDICVTLANALQCTLPLLFSIASCAVRTYQRMLPWRRWRLGAPQADVLQVGEDVHFCIKKAI